MKRSLSFYLLAAFFGLFVLFLYGPMVTIFILSLQGPDGALTFPVRSFGFYWLGQVFQEQRVGNFVEPFQRSLALGALVTVLAAGISMLGAMAFRLRFRGSTALFYLTVACRIVRRSLISQGVGVMVQVMGGPSGWYSSGLGAHLSWTVPVAFLIMLGVLNRFNP
ncbi:MAG: ABC transporter permease, partial [Elainellaceae cyanobacterium]